MKLSLVGRRRCWCQFLILELLMLVAHEGFCAGGTGCVPVPSGVVSWWRGDGSAADSADSNPGTLMGGATTTSGLVGQAFNFSGAGAAVQVPDAPNLRFTNALTIEGWIYPRTVGGVWHEVISKWEGGVDQRSYLIDIDPDTYLVFAVSSNGTDNAQSNLGRIVSLAPMSTNQWAHVAATYDGSLIKLYVNGILQTNMPWPGGVFPGTAPLIIGSTLETGSVFDGLIDEVSLYSRALTASEIQGIYAAGADGKCFGPSNVPPVIVSEPTNRTITAGSSTTFNVAATGTLPLSYQWQFNGTNISGATNISLVLSNVQPSQAGSYRVFVTNIAGTAISSNALLTVLTATNNCVPPGSGMVAWWRAENNANDSVDGNAGTVIGGLGYGPGEVNQAFVFDGTSGYIRVPTSSGLDVGTSSNGLTIECWIKPGDLSTPRPLVEWNDGSAYGVHFWVAEPWFEGQGGPGALFANIIDTSGATHALVTASGTLNTNSWQHVAVTYDKVSGLGVLYVNGTVAYSHNLGFFTPQTTYDLYLGRRLAPDILTNYNGLMDEVSIYSRALSQTEIQAIVSADGSGKCTTNRPPVASNMFAATHRNQSMGIPVDKFLLLSSDPDGDALTVGVSPISTNGGSVFLATNTVIYFPPTNYIGSDRFAYVVNDGRGGTNAAFVLIEVRSSDVQSGNMLPPVAVSNGFLVSFVGIPSYSYSLQRATNIGGPWRTLGSVTAGANGLGTFTDTNPLPASAFYRTTYP